MLCFYWGVVVPDHNKEPDPRATHVLRLLNKILPPYIAIVKEACYEHA